MPPSVRKIIEDVAAAHGTTALALLGPSRLRRHAVARQEAMAALREGVSIGGSPPSYPLIGRWMNRDHSTVMWGIRRHAERVAA